MPVRTLADRRKYVVVTGAIAAGASTLAQALVEAYGWGSHLEGHVEIDNEFFTDAYADFGRWGFHSQVHFLLASVHRHQALRTALADPTPGPSVIVEDRSPFEHSGAYLLSYERLGRITGREARLLRDLTEVIEPHYLTPDLLVYRKIDREQLLERIRQRDRPGEEVADQELLEVIRRSFDDFIDGWSRSPVFEVAADADVLDEGVRSTLLASIKHAVDQS